MGQFYTGRILWSISVLAFVNFFCGPERGAKDKQAEAVEPKTKNTACSVSLMEVKIQTEVIQC